MSRAGGTPEGWGLFSYDRGMGSTGMHCIGSNLDAPLTSVQVNTLAIILGKTADTFKARDARGFVKEITITGADPTGTLFWKPVRMSAKSGFSISLGGYGEIVSEPFSLAHPSFQPTLDVRLADYRRLAADGVAQAVLERWTGFDMLRFEGRISNDLLSKYVPLEYRDGTLGTHTVRDPQTIIGDDFTEAGNTALASHVPTGANAWTGSPEWTQLAGSITVIAATDVAQQSNGTTTSEVRANQDLSSDDNYAQYVSNYSGIAESENAVFTRKDSTATRTWYGFQGDDGSNLYKLRKVVGGTFSTVATAVTFDGSSGDTIRIETDGSNISGKVNGSTKMSGTDATITANLRTGGRLRGNTGNEMDDWEASDLAAPPAGTATQQIIIIGWTPPDWMAEMLHRVGV